MEIRSPEYTVAEYCEMYDRKDVRVNRQYQRSDEVWPRTAQSFLIETILLNFPIPKLFLHQHTDLRTSKTLRDIVDGQQRTKAVVDFFHNEYRLTKNVTTEEAVGRSFSELPDEMQRQFLDYGLNFDTFVGATDGEVREVFRRMNSFTVPLNFEEQRHALYQGEFKWFMNRLAAGYTEAFRTAGIFNQKSLVRMQDQKLLTEIVSAVLSGISTTNRRTLDNVYRDHDKPESFQESQQADLGRRLRRGLDTMFQWTDLHRTPLMRPHETYSLVLAIMHFQEPWETLSAWYTGPLQMAPSDLILVNLSRLAEALERGEEANPVLLAFVRASSERTNVISQRGARFKWFCEALADQLPK